MLRDLHLLHLLTQGGTITGSVLSDNADLLRSLGLEGKKRDESTNCQSLGTRTGSQDSWPARATRGGESGGRPRAAAQAKGSRASHKPSAARKGVGGRERDRPRKRVANSTTGETPRAASERQLCKALFLPLLYSSPAPSFALVGSLTIFARLLQPALARSHFVPPAPARLLGAFFPSLAQKGISTLDGREKCWRRRGKRTPELIFQEMCLPEISLGKVFRKRARSCALPRAGPLKPTDGRQGVRLRGEARRARGTMHSATYRLNAVATMAFTGLLALCLAVSVTGKFVRGREARVSAHSTLAHHHPPPTHT